MAKKIKRGDKIASSRSRKGNEEEDFIKDLLGRAVEKLGKDSKINKEISKVEKNVSILVSDRVPEVVLDFEKKDKKKLN